MFRKLCLILMLAFLMIAGNAKAAHVYWKPSSGNDSNAGTSTSAPVKTLARAIEVLKTQYQADPSTNWIIVQMEEWSIANTDNGEIVIDGKIDDTHNALVLRLPDMRNYMIKYIQTTNSGANTLKLSNITFHGNSTPNAWSQGNGNQNNPIMVIGQNRTVIMEDGCVLTENQHTAPFGETLNGAGVVINDGATLVMNGGEISKCKSNNYGAGVYNGAGGTFTMNGGEIFECVAGGTANYGQEEAHPRGSGGGVYMGAGSTVTVAGGEIHHCTAYQFGGGMRLVGSAERQTTVTITKCDIHDCIANTTIDNYGRGGGIDFVNNVVATIDGDEVLIHNNRCQCYGGGIQIQAGATVYFKKGKIYENIANRGSITSATVCGAAGVHSTNESRFVMSGGEIYGNYTPGVGGGIHTSYEGTMEITGGKIYGNHAGCQGGAINLNTNCNLSIPEGSTLQMYDNTAGRGGAVCCDAANVWVYAGSIHDNHAVDTVLQTVFTKGIGGAFSLIMENTQTGHEFRPANMYIYGGEIYNNTASVDGGAIYLKKNSEQPTAGFPTMHIQGGKLYNNTAYKGNGGAIFADDETTFYMEANEEVTPNTQGEIYGNEAELGNGGAVYLGKATVYISAGSFSENTAKLNGGGFFLNEGNVTISGGSIFGNTANNNGGGFYVSDGNITITDGEVKNNTATTGNGGGFYSAGGTVNISNAIISGNHADNGFGGGLYSAAAITVGTTTAESGATVLGNYAKDGAGFYVAGASESMTTIQGNSIISGNIATEDGGGAYIASGNLTVNSSDVKGNHADNGNGGGFYVQGGNSTINGGTVQNNEATNGGGLYMLGTDGSHKAIANFSNGSFSGNSATTAGGGIYLASNSELYMSGSSAITGNSAGVKGGGVFKTAGNGHSKLQVSGTSLQVVNNTVGSQRNNVYLDSYSDYITVDPVAGISDQVKVGISVNVNSTADLPTPVIHCDNVSKLNEIFNMLKNPDGTSGVFDDASKYLAIYQSHPLPFNDKEIFFIATWIADVTEPEHFDATKISTPEELTWFMVLVNGLNGQTPQTELNGTVINDIDMSAYYWTPIGEWNHSDPAAPQSVYNGTFDGQGHTISGVSTCGVINYYNYGLFGHTSNANISNVVLADCDFTSGETKRMGNLIAEMDGGTVSNCIVSGKLNPSGSETQGGEEHYCVVGGLIGETKNNAIIRNCIATEQIQAEPIVNEFYPGMQAFTVGGLVGMASSGTVIENCFANTEIQHGGNQGNETTLMNPNRYVGGLIGENYGTVRNCYVRLERNNELTTTVSKFGMFAGRNSGTIDYCYYPVESLRNIKVGGVSAPNQIVVNDGTAPTNHGQYSAVTRPYTYTSYLVDNQVDGGTTEATTLLSKLNDWVGNQTNYSNYSHWMRTEGSDVNDDYPVLSYDNLISTLDYTTVGSKDGIQLEYDNRFNDMYGRFKKVGEGCLFIYRTPWTGTIASPADEVIGHDPDDEDFTVDNSENDIKVFVKDGVALLQDASSKLENTYTCHKFNDASRTWHHISSSLNSDSPIGFSYAQTGVIGYDESAQNPCGASVMSEANASFLPAGIPMADLDLYCFYETEYHWINFKRNSSSHWHMNDQHQNITYNNEDNLLAGKGYLASFANRTFVQAGGELANGDVNVGVTAKAGSLNGSATPAIPAEEGTELKGYNLLGNPYQSYLDIAAFMTENSSLLVNTGKSGIDVPSYAIYDSEANAYVQGMASKPSLGSRAASDQIRMHEGFFIYTSANGNATFTNEMRRTPYTSTGTKSTEQPAYPLVNLMVTDANGESDIAVAEFGRTQTEGAAKMKHIGADGKIYFHYADDDYALLYLNEDIDQLPVRFDAIEDGNYTMTWSTANATFSYLHLVDNMTGIDVDMLSSDGYTFTAGTSDYKSRFKLMFAYTGVEENGAAEMETFAFMHDGALTVNGEGWLEVIDMNGRTIVSSRLTDAQNTVSLPQTAQGVYVLRLTSDNQSKVQKIVVR